MTNVAIGGDIPVQMQLHEPRRICVLDRSGSMSTVLDDTIGGYNSFVETQHGGTMSLYVFDHELSNVYDEVPISNVIPLNKTSYVPRGSTALLDALGHILKKDYDGDKVIMIILTDGEENASTKYTHEHIKDLIEMRTKEGWDFVYIGANHDTFAVGQRLGIRTTCNFSPHKSHQLFRELSSAVTQASQSGECVVMAEKLD